MTKTTKIDGRNLNSQRFIDDIVIFSKKAQQASMPKRLTEEERKDKYNINKNPNIMANDPAGIKERRICILYRTKEGNRSYIQTDIKIANYEL